MGRDPDLKLEVTAKLLLDRLNDAGWDTFSSELLIEDIQPVDAKLAEAFGKADQAYADFVILLELKAAL